jgi:biotin carboxylase
MTTVLVTGEGLPLLARLRASAPDAFIICATTSRGRAIRELRQLSDRLIVMNGRDVATWVDMARELRSGQVIDAACAFGEMGQPQCAAIAADLGLPWHSVTTIQRVYDKATMRQRLREAGLSALQATPVRDAAELTALAAGSATPLIVKPRSGSGGTGIRLIRSAREAGEAFAYATGTGRYGGRAVVAETFAAGEEFSVEAFGHRGAHSVVAITRKIVARETKAELGHIVPADIPPELAARLQDFIPRCLDALGITFGPTHTEVMVSATGLEVIETHTRCGGGRIPDLVQLATGVDLMDLTVRQAIGRLPAEDLPPAHPGAPGSAARCAGLFFLTPDRPGAVAGPPGGVPAAGGDQLVTLDLSELEESDGGQVPVSNLGRGAYCIVRGSSPADVVRAAASVAADVRVDVRVPEGEVRPARLALAAATFPSDGLPTCP